MNTLAAPPARPRRKRLHVLVGTLLTLLVVLTLVLAFFPWDWLRPPLNRYISEKTGRTFLTQKLEVHWHWRGPELAVEGLSFANPEWAKVPLMVAAQRVEAQVLWSSLWARPIKIEMLRLVQPAVALEQDAQGRQSWSLQRDSSPSAPAVQIKQAQIDQGQLQWRDALSRTDITAQVQLQPEVQSLPLSFSASGQWRKQTFQAQGRTASVLRFTDFSTDSANRAAAFPVQLTAQAGSTRLQAQGMVNGFHPSAPMDLNFKIQGSDLSQLYELAGVVLPSTPPYSVSGRLIHQAALWKVEQLKGQVGDSDLRGTLSYSLEQGKHWLRGNLTSHLLDLDDLGAALGATPGTGSGETASAAQRANAQQREQSGRVLPSKKFDVSRLNAMNADVSFASQTLRRAAALPIDSLSFKVQLQDGLLTLNPITFGVAKGQVSGSAVVNARTTPPQLKADLKVTRLQLAALFPTQKLAQTSQGSVGGEVQLQGQGNSLAEALGSSSGKVNLAIANGQVSNLLIELLGIDIAEALKFYVAGDKTIYLRCGLAAFDVHNGEMKTQALVIDTTDTVVQGQGGIDLKQERLDLLFRPQPKDKSWLSLRSPLRISGTFAQPKAGPDKSALLARGGAALGLGLINPFLALFALVETGPGNDTDCSALLNQHRVQFLSSGLPPDFSATSFPVFYLLSENSHA